MTLSDQLMEKQPGPSHFVLPFLIRSGPFRSSWPLFSFLAIHTPYSLMMNVNDLYVFEDDYQSLLKYLYPGKLTQFPQHHARNNISHVDITFKAQRGQLVRDRNK